MGARGVPPHWRPNTRGFCTGEIKPQIQPDRAATGSGRNGLSSLPAVPRRASSPGAAAGKLPDFAGDGVFFNCVGIVISHIPPAGTARRFGSCPRPRNWRGWRQEDAIKPLPGFFPLGAGTEHPGKVAPAGEVGLKAAAPAGRERGSAGAPSISWSLRPPAPGTVLQGKQPPLKPGCYPL